jgi:hypothetical protein
MSSSITELFIDHWGISKVVTIALLSTTLFFFADPYLSRVRAAAVTVINWYYPLFRTMQIECDIFISSIRPSRPSHCRPHHPR